MNKIIIYFVMGKASVVGWEQTLYASANIDDCVKYINDNKAPSYWDTLWIETQKFEVYL